MRVRAHRWIVSVVALVALVALGQSARADVSPKVIKALKGQIIVSKEPVESGASDKDTIAEFKKAKLSEIKGEPNADDVVAWHFHYTAFLKGKSSPNLALEFHKGKKYVADQRLTGVDPKLTVLEGDISITEDDGPSRGTEYTLKLVGKSNGKDVVLATTTLKLN
ncbi:MAG: hypothetical protein H6709_17915 [Kofleriaceae bacterium]|nr:hypothetical protein [Myxococcales bacterium]MCB9573961.1 hypothetical protein [Kofleriaceae bacterium]